MTDKQNCSLYIRCKDLILFGLYQRFLTLGKFVHFVGNFLHIQKTLFSINKKKDKTDYFLKVELNKLN